MIYCYLNGKIIPIGKACIPVNDLLITRGYGAFDFLRTYNGKPFLVREHFTRFRKSADALDIKIPVSQDKFQDIVKKLLKMNNLKEAAIRVVVTGGQNNKNHTFFVLMEKIHEFPKSVYEKGIALNTYEYQRNMPYAKTTDYLVAIKLERKNKKAGALEILYKNKNFLTEATTSNFFIFKGETLITPKQNVLIGITRNLVMRLARSKFQVKEKNISIKDLKTATEAFITATSKAIVPVVRVDKQKIGNGRVGDNTLRLMKAFQEFVKKY